MNSGVTASGQVLAIKHLEDKNILARFLTQKWGHDGVVVMGKVWTSKDLNVISACDNKDQLLAIAGWVIKGDTLILASIDSIFERNGVASVLIDAIVAHAKLLNAKRVRAVVTNDNFEAMRFYQRRDFRFTALYVNAADAYRAIFQDTPKTGYYGIPIRDTLELELVL
jgi:ribosomal protein S18 acetylase RimI-like enzyme